MNGSELGKKEGVGIFSFAYDNFAPLIVFLIAEHLVSLRAAIAAGLVFGCVDITYRLIRKHEVTRLYWFSFFSTLVFGAIDLTSKDPFIFRYEAVATNLITAGFFGITLFRGKPLIREIAEKGMTPEKAARPDIQKYLWFLTAAWTVYFVLKAITYFIFAFYYSDRYTFDQILAFRSGVGTISLVVMLFGERLIRKPLFLALKGRGWLGSDPQFGGTT